jgi:hypothetical protein
MTEDLISRSRVHARRRVIDVVLIATAVSLIVSLAIAATVVSIGIARAETLGPVIQM